MNQRMAPARPAWVSDEIFPFESNFFTTPSGHEMHFIDEGAGEPIVFLHGNPTWSFEFRHLVRDLRSRFRCIAPDHIGFGLSSRSHQPADYRPEAHADAVAALLDHLDVQDLTLYLVDWGGPIGLDFARKHPDRVKRIVITNTWCWPVARDPHYIMFSFFMSSWLGQYLIKRHNFFVNKVLPMAVAQKDALTPDVMTHYRNAQPTPEARSACAAFPGHIVGATDWLRRSGMIAPLLPGNLRSYSGDSKTSPFERRNSAGGRPSWPTLKRTSSRIADTSWPKKLLTGCCPRCTPSWSEPGSAMI